jgi:hypothetical protein
MDEDDEVELCGSCGHFEGNDCELLGGEVGYEDEACPYHTELEEE